MAMPRSPRILGIVGSVRSLYPAEEFEQDLLRLGTFDDTYNHIYSLASNRRICNTDGAMIAACFGAAEQGGAVSIARLIDFLGGRGRTPAEGRQALREAVARADGLIVGTPVYFGDRSSFVEQLFNLLEEQGGLPLLGKSLGFVSVGAKRNGGQETTNILGLNDAMGLGANIVGNGPPTSQYGGTAVAGDLGAVLDDNHGLLSSYGTGGRVARIASMPKLAKAAAPPRLLALYTATPPEEHRHLLRESLPQGVALQELFLDQYELGHCLACHTCPHPASLRTSHPCIQTEGMVEIRRRLLEADGVLLVGSFTGTRSLTHYQVFAERTRFIRRHNFELANIPVGLVVFARPAGGQNFPLRATNLALRHNMIVVGPGYTGHLDHGRVRPSLRDLSRYLRHLVSQTQRYNLSRQLWQGHDLYEAVGYAH